MRLSALVKSSSTEATNFQLAFELQALSQDL